MFDSSFLRVGRRGVMAMLGALLAAGLPRGAAAEPLDSLADALDRLTSPTTPPRFSFTTADGAKRTLADYRGQGVVLNIWATWCGPCVAEMPSLDRLSAAVRKFAIAVLPISIDAQGLPVVKQFYAAHHITHLPMLLDPDGDAAHAFKVAGIPASFIIDRQGGIAGRTLGAVQWDAAAAIAAIRQMVGARA